MIKLEFEADKKSITPKAKITMQHYETNSGEMMMLIEYLVELILEKDTKITREEIYQFGRELSKSRLKGKNKKIKEKRQKKKEVKNGSSSKQSSKI